jgi:hypothetical protein
MAETNQHPNMPSLRQSMKPDGKVDASARRSYMAAMHDPSAIIMARRRRRRCRDTARACMRV